MGYPTDNKNIASAGSAEHPSGTCKDSVEFIEAKLNKANIILTESNMAISEAILHMGKLVYYIGLIVKWEQQLEQRKSDLFSYV